MTVTTNAIAGTAAGEELRATIRRLVRQINAEIEERTSADAQGRWTALSEQQHLELVGELIDRALDGYASDLMHTGFDAATPEVEGTIRRALRNRLIGVGDLQLLLDDPQIENINARGCDVVWVRYPGNRREPAGPIADSDEELVELIQMIARRHGVGERRFDPASPQVSVQLRDGSRLFAVMGVGTRPFVSIRRHRHRQVALRELRNLGLLDSTLEAFFTAAVIAKCNILIAGGTGVGKTTFLRGLASAIPAGERLITVEDAFELALDADPGSDVHAMQVREPNIEGEGGVDMAQLVRNALRMDPDRVIVGEVRGAEVIALLNSMSQGTDGSMATIHASDSKGAFLKIATYAVQAPERLSPAETNVLAASALDLVVHLGYADDGTRVVTSVREVLEPDGMQISSNEVFRPDPTGRAVVGSPPSMSLLARLESAGFDPSQLHHGGVWST